MEQIKNQANDIKNYDFEKSRKFSATNLKFLEKLSYEYAKSSNLQLQYELKHQDLKSRVMGFEQQVLSEFLEKTNYDTVLIDFSVGRAKDMIIRVDKLCALTFVESLLGGDGTVLNESREITEIDMAILTYLNETLLQKLAIDANKTFPVLTNAIYTNTAQFKTPLQSSESLFISRLDILLRNNKVGEVSICIPLSSVECIISEIAFKQNKDSISEAGISESDALEYENKIINTLHENKVTFDIVAELGKTTITVGELLELNTDDVLILNRKITDNIDVLVGNSLAYKAQPGTLGLKKAVTINDFAEKGEINNAREENN